MAMAVIHLLQLSDKLMAHFQHFQSEILAPNQYKKPLMKRGHLGGGEHYSQSMNQLSTKAYKPGTDTN
jgi:hypothetical protein